MSKPKEAPRRQLQHAELEVFENAVYRRDHEAAGRLLMETFRRLRTGASFAFLSLDERHMAVYYTRLASAIAALLTDPQFEFSEEGFPKIAIESSMIAAVFEASTLETSDHLARALCLNPEQRDPNEFDFDVLGLAKWLIFYGFNSALDMDFEALFKKAPSIGLPLWASWLAAFCNVTPLAHARRERLLTLGTYFESLPEIPNETLPAVSDAYMYSSYCVGDQKHEVKRSIMALLRGSMTRNVPSLPSEGELRDRRGRAKRQGRHTMLVPLEHFGSFHAMYRCYAPIIEGLREEFKLIGCARASQTDETSRRLFDDFLPLPEGNVVFEGVARQIRKLAPDVAFYPSVGMALWWVAFSSVRLAPVQIMSLGHPASSFSPVMDYMVAEESTISDPALFTERVAVVPDWSSRFAQRPDAAALGRARDIFLAKKNDEDKETVRIAIPSMSLKVTWPFVEMLGRVSSRASRPVEYHFFPSSLGVVLAQMRHHLQTTLPKIVVRPRADYAQYLYWLGLCDLSLAPYPFGGTNSTIDSLLIGMPVLTKIGPQPHERGDALLLRRIGLGELVVETAEAYEERLLELIETAGERERLEGLISAVDRDAAFYAEPKNHDSYPRAISYLYRNHEAIVESGARLIHWEKFL